MLGLKSALQSSQVIVEVICCMDAEEFIPLTLQAVAVSGAQNMETFQLSGPQNPQPQ